MQLNDTCACESKFTWKAFEYIVIDKTTKQKPLPIFISFVVVIMDLDKLSSTKILIHSMTTTHLATVRLHKKRYTWKQIYRIRWRDPVDIPRDTSHAEQKLVDVFLYETLWQCMQNLNYLSESKILCSNTLASLLCKTRSGKD